MTDLEYPLDETIIGDAADLYRVVGQLNLCKTEVDQLKEELARLKQQNKSLQESLEHETKRANALLYK